MKLENQVVSLELAQKLRELGVKQESFAYWVGDKTYDVHGESHRDYHLHYIGFCTGGISAYTAGELGEMLPVWTTTHIFSDDAEEGKYAVECIGTHTGQFYANTEADARAEMLIYLLENKLITL